MPLYFVLQEHITKEICPYTLFYRNTSQKNYALILCSTGTHHKRTMPLYFVLQEHITKELCSDSLFYTESGVQWRLCDRLLALPHTAFLLSRIHCAERESTVTDTEMSRAIDFTQVFFTTPCVCPFVRKTSWHLLAFSWAVLKQKLDIRADYCVLKSPKRITA